MIPTALFASANPVTAAVGTAINAFKVAEVAHMITTEKSDGTTKSTFLALGPKVPSKKKESPKVALDYSEKHPRNTTKPRSERMSDSS